MLDLLQATILSSIQGITELLPISSSGHLILVSEILNIKPTVELLAFLHLSSAVAIIICYSKKLKELLISKQWLVNGTKIIVALAPVAIIGIFIEGYLEEILYKPFFVGVNLIVWGLAMVITERLEQKETLKAKKSKLEEISYIEALGIGLMQVLSLIPGTSRSGVTTMGGIWLGIKKSTALDFSFIIGIPALLGAYFLQSLKFSSISPVELNRINIYMLFATFIVSYFAISLLRKFSNKKFLTFFGIYRIILGFIILFMVWNRSF